MTGSRSSVRLAATATVLVGCALAQFEPGLASAAGLPNPCTAVSSTLVASALGVKHAPPGKLTSVNQTATCAFGSSLTVFVGLTVIGNPAPAAHVSAVAGLPNGMFMSYNGSTQTEIRFVVGGTAAGVYGVVRNYAKIKKAKLVKIAVALDAAITGASGAGTAPSTVHLVTG